MEMTLEKKIEFCDFAIEKLETIDSCLIIGLCDLFGWFTADLPFIMLRMESELPVLFYDIKRRQDIRESKWGWNYNSRKVRINYLQKLKSELNMIKYKKTYCDYFGYFEQDFLPCEVCKSKSVDVHHIVYLSRGDKNNIENLIGLCRNCHVDAHNEILKPGYLQDIHNEFMKSNKSER